MKKNNVLTKILCVFKPKKMPSDILTEAENIINQYISHDVDFIEQNHPAKINAAFILSLILLVLLQVLPQVCFLALV